MSDFFDSTVKKTNTIVWPTLYARTSTGAVQVWWVEQEDEKYHSISGQMNGQKIVAADTVAKGKNQGKKNPDKKGNAIGGGMITGIQKAPRAVGENNVAAKLPAFYECHMQHLHP